jgi:hypothetical protein
VIGGCRSVQACREGHAHLAREPGAATPTASHPRPQWAPDEIECRVLLKLPYTNPSPTLAAALRHTITVERQNGAVLLLKVNVLAAAQTDGHVSGASSTARVIELPFVAFARGVPQLFHFTAGLERKPHFRRAGEPQDQSAEVPRGTSAGDSRPFRVPCARFRPSARTRYQACLAPLVRGGTPDFKASHHRGRRSANAVSQRRRRAGNSSAVMLWPPTFPAGGTGVLGRRNLGCTRVRMIKQRTLYTEGQWSRAWIATRDGSGY